jgi:hypothetical protein
MQASGKTTARTSIGLASIAGIPRQRQLLDALDIDTSLFDRDRKQQKERVVDL